MAGPIGTWNSLIRSSVAQARARERQARYEERLARLNHIANEEQRADAENDAVASQLAMIGSVLRDATSRDVDVPIDTLLRHAHESDLDADVSLVVPKEPQWRDFRPFTLGILASVFEWARVRDETALKAAQDRFEKAKEKRLKVITHRIEAFRALQAEVDAHNAAIKALPHAIEEGDLAACALYAEHVLLASPYPTDFPKRLRVAPMAEAAQLVIEYELPSIDSVVPSFDNYRYIKASDQIVKKDRPEPKRQRDYLSLVSQIALRTIHEVFASQHLQRISSVVFSGYVETIDRRTGQQIQPHLVSLRVSRSRWQSLRLDRVDPIECLRDLCARVTPSAKEMVPIPPIVRFDMVDPRFVTEQDVLSTLDTRPNLMDLNPSEFESLVTNLFQKMGLDTRLTRASRDGGVDCVAWDPRPVLGGKVIVQAKRYKNTVGVSAVRDLYGAMQEERASKGVLVTTSGYGPASQEFANGKPIELIGGPQLLALLRDHAGIDARIIMPDSWNDPLGAMIE